MAVILFFGDSITFGAWDEEGGWVARLHRHINKKIIGSRFSEYHHVYNLGISGDTTTTLLQRFENEVKARLRESGEYIFIFAIGINDSQINKLTNTTQTTVEEFEKNLAKLFEKAKVYPSKIVFVGLTPVDEEVVNSDPNYPDDAYMNTPIQVFNNEIKNFCTKENILFIDMFGEWTRQDYKTLLIDGLHPDTKGHEKMYQKIVKVLENNQVI